jgi:hypothetical protein
MKSTVSVRAILVEGTLEVMAERSIDKQKETKGAKENKDDGRSAVFHFSV